MIGLVDKNAHLWTVSLSSDLNEEIIPPLRRRFSSIQPRASLSLLVNGLASPKKQHLCMGCFLLLEWCQNVCSQPKVTVTAAMSRSYKKKCNVYLVLTNGPWVLTAEPLRFVLPLKVRKEEKGAESPLGRGQFLQRNEESFHHVSCKPVMVPRWETERNREVMVSKSQPKDSKATVDTVNHSFTLELLHQSSGNQFFYMTKLLSECKCRLYRIC